MKGLQFRGITFLNGDPEFKKRGIKHLESRIEDFDFFNKYHYFDDIEELKEDPEFLELSKKEQKTVINKFDSIGSFCYYGLDFSFVELGTFEYQKEGYYRYQLSYGGPSDEIRFYASGEVEYVFLDWFTGVGFDVSNIECFIWLKEYFQDVQMIDWESISLEQIRDVD